MAYIRVEFLVAFTDHTWDTIFRDVPATFVENDQLREWFHTNVLAGWSGATAVAGFDIYHIGEVMEPKMNEDERRAWIDSNPGLRGYR